ncbi:GAF and ANTAR domain-containing protein [Arthrobacter sp. SX1312]|uniref:GAF and ANTAR domain-containing protein n=1 Tax=Arthrobacter sp. SX1312 TaxID=2058896 RepID=UPI0021579166|nr:GAF and ANTAR domain-containing protein [Arthrobacter sp. SX1312]
MLNLPGDDDLCAVFLTELPVTGAAISIFVGTANETRMGATDDRAIALDEAQFSVGEGPRWDAMRTRAPVIVPDTRAAHLEWPALGTALADAGAAAVFVLPLIVGAVNIGVVEMYHTRPGSLSAPTLLHAQTLTSTTSWALMHSILDEGRRNPGAMTESEPLARREIHQATGMILVQADVSAAEALMLLRAHAFAHEQTLAEAAQAVINRSLNFAAEPDAVSDSAGSEEH